MRCKCGYEGVPTVHHEDPAAPRPEFRAHPHGWKCPACHRPRPADLRHDWVRDPDAADALTHYCSQCGMRAGTDAEDRTPCPGTPPGNGWQEVACACGERGPYPGPYPATAPCRRCGQPYPVYAPAPPAAGRRARVSPEEVEALKAEIKAELLKELAAAFRGAG